MYMYVYAQDQRGNGNMNNCTFHEKEDYLSLFFLPAMLHINQNILQIFYKSKVLCQNSGRRYYEENRKSYDMEDVRCQTV